MKLENIRSYQEQEIHFPLGTTLFEGDIGSGKSTILMAIEFALFGLGSEKGGALLRVGSHKGSVTLSFVVSDTEYEVYRSLEKKGKRAHQGTDCYIKTPEGILHLSPSEMKARILEILNFNEPPDPKARSVIYRYAVFTPQEEMKAILSMPSENRLQTLRKALRIEDYMIAVENTLNISKCVKQRFVELDSQASDLDDKIEMREQKEHELAEDEEILKGLKEEEIDLQDKLDKLKDKDDQLNRRKDGLSKSVGEIPLLENRIEEKKEGIVGYQNRIQKTTEEMDGLQQDIDKLNRIQRPTPKTEEVLNKDIQHLRREKNELVKKIASIETKIHDFQSILENCVCPTCDRPVDSAEFMEKIEEKKQEEKNASEAVDQCDQEINETERILKELREFSIAQEKLKDLDGQMKRNGEVVKEYREEIGALNNQIEDAKKKLKSAKTEIEELEKVGEKICSNKKEMEKVREQLENIREDVSSKGTEVKMLKKQIVELGEEIKQKEEKRQQGTKLKEYHIWLQDFFIPTLSNIEKHVMNNIRQDFNNQFWKWFTLLVEDTSKEARIDETFTPIIDQDGYEQDIFYLSGGEKTSIALAYRLALNHTVQKVSIGMKSNLLILDEPTDGFSKEQLFNVRDILNEIRSPQTIIVSHERELESFADHVLKIEKREGISRIEKNQENI